MNRSRFLREASIVLCVLAWPACHLAAQTASKTEETGDAPEWRSSANFETWLYGQGTGIRADSLLNPDNHIARLPSQLLTLDARINGRVEYGNGDFVWNLRGVGERRGVAVARASNDYSSDGSMRVGQAVLRYKQASNTMALGRELFSWGPGNFRSPSNPFYFDAGRTNPLAATPGVDLARVTFGHDKFRLTGAYVFSTSQITPAIDLGHTALLKLDHQGSEHLLSLIASHQRDGANFVGAFAQFKPDDAWMVYGEAGSSRQVQTLTPGSAAVPPLFSLQLPGSRVFDMLLGATYTRENGQTLTAEWLHNNGGYSSDAIQAYFRQAGLAGQLTQLAPAAGYAMLGQALGSAPRMLGRDYLWLSWQSNTQESKYFWRVSWTQNFTDHSGQLSLYGEKNVWPRVSVFASLSANRGGTSTEYGALFRNSLIAGVKLFVF